MPRSRRLRGRTGRSGLRQGRTLCSHPRSPRRRWRRASSSPPGRGLSTRKTPSSALRANDPAVSLLMVSTFSSCGSRTSPTSRGGSWTASSSGVPRSADLTACFCRAAASCLICRTAAKSLPPPGSPSASCSICFSTVARTGDVLPTNGVAILEACHLPLPCSHGAREQWRLGRRRSDGCGDHRRLTPRRPGRREALEPTGSPTAYVAPSVGSPESENQSRREATAIRSSPTYCEPEHPR